eukprot:g403.t1
MAAGGQISKANYDMYRVRKTVNKMLDNRGYLVSKSEMEMSADAFQAKFNLQAASRDQFSILVQKKDDPSDQLFVFFPDDAKVGVKPIRQYVERMKEQQVTKAIIVVKEGVTPFARSAVNELAPKYLMEHFKEGELLVDITEHKLVPKHSVMTEAEKKALLQRYKLKESQLPRMQLSDPISRYYGLTRGQVMKIVRPSETAGRYVTYRIVW